MKIETYEGIEDMPISRYQDFNIAILIDAGIGTDTEAFDKHIITALKFIEQGEKDKAKQEVLNLRQSIVMSLNRISPETTAFAAWVKMLNGKDVTSMSAEQVAKLIETRYFTVGYIRQRISDLKKKVMRSLRLSSRIL